MKVEEMSTGELRLKAARGYVGRAEGSMLDAFDELARRLTLKDADLLLERDRAEKAKKQVAHFEKTLYMPGLKLTAVQDTDPVQEIKAEAILNIIERAEKSEAQVKMLVEALTISRGQWIHSVNAKQCEEALAKIKEES